MVGNLERKHAMLSTAENSRAKIYKKIGEARAKLARNYTLE